MTTEGPDREALAARVAAHAEAVDRIAPDEPGNVGYRAIASAGFAAGWDARSALLPSPPAPGDQSPDLRGDDHWPTTPVQCSCGWRHTDASETWAQHFAALAAPPAPGTCGHPNHGAADHDCAPFTPPAPEARLHEFTPSGGPEPKHAPWCWCQSYLTTPPAPGGGDTDLRALDRLLGRADVARGYADQSILHEQNRHDYRLIAAALAARDADRDALARVRVLSEAATPGEWRAISDGYGDTSGGRSEDERRDLLWVRSGQTNTGDVVSTYGMWSERSEADVQLIAAAVNYVRATLAPAATEEKEADDA